MMRLAMSTDKTLRTLDLPIGVGHLAAHTSPVLPLEALTRNGPRSRGIAKRRPLDGEPYPPNLRDIHREAAALICAAASENRSSSTAGSSASVTR